MIYGYMGNNILSVSSNYTNLKAINIVIVNYIMRNDISVVVN